MLPDFQSGFSNGALGSFIAGTQPASAERGAAPGAPNPAQPGAQPGQPNIMQLLAQLLGGQTQQPGQGNNALAQILAAANPRALDPVAQANAGTRDMHGFSPQAQWDSWGDKNAGQGFGPGAYIGMSPGGYGARV